MGLPLTRRGLIAAYVTTAVMVVLYATLAYLLWTFTG